MTTTDPGPAERELRVSFAKRRDPGIMWGRTWGQLVCAVVGMVGAILVVRGIHDGLRWGWLIVAVVGITLTFARTHGRPTAEVLPGMLADWVVRLTGDHVYRGGASRLVNQVDHGATVRTSPELPGELSQAEIRGFLGDTGRPVGVTVGRKDGTYTAVLEVVGDTFNLLDTGDANGHAKAFGALLDGLAREDTVLHAIQLLHRVVPDHGDGARRDLNTRATGGHAGLRAALTNLVAAEAGQGVRHESYVVVKIKPGKNRREWKAAGGGDEGAAALLYQIVARIYRDLSSCGVTVIGWLPPRGVAAAVRSALDPSADDMIARRGGGDDDVAGGDTGLESGVHPAAAEPGYMERFRSYVAHNDHVSRTWWVTEYPRATQGVPVGFLQPLILDVRARHTLSIVLEPLGHRKAARVVESQASTSEAQTLMDQKIGRRQKRSQQREQADLQRREDDHVEGHAVYRLAAFVSLTARSLPELERLSPQIESAMNAASMEGNRWYVETDQAFVAAALPFATGLNS